MASIDGTIVFRMRQALGLSREKFADIIGCSANAVFFWEKRGRSIAKRFRVKLEKLYRKLKEEGKL